MNSIDKYEVIQYLKSLKPQLEANGIERIGVFGSVARDEADLLSDIDIMIRTTPGFVNRYHGAKGLIYLDDLRQKIATHFGRKVDICDESGLKKKMSGVIYA